jgi:hypothetical protein
MTPRETDTGTPSFEGAADANRKLPAADGAAEGASRAPELSEAQLNMARLRELRLAKEAEAVRARITKANGQARAGKSRTRYR